MDGKSLSPQQEKLKQLKQILPEAFTEGKIDWEKLKATLGEDINFSAERYVLNWAGKSDAFKAMQAPSFNTLAPAKEQSANFDQTEHIFIEGDNLDVLKILQKSYFGKVKMIYIDPPYNTGNDSFIYLDRFAESKEDYQRRVGDKDENGCMTKEGKFRKNSKENGQYHSNWLNMIYPRLFLARNLLQQDGVIFVSIDDNEVHNLRLLMNEVFGEENFVAQITIQSNPRGRQAEWFVATVHEYILVYARNAEQTIIKGATLTEKQSRDFKYQDESGRKYRLLGLRQRGSASRRQDRPKMFFPLYVDPETKTVSTTKTDQYFIEVLPKKSTGEDGRWMWGQQKVQNNLKQLEARLILVRNEWDIFVRDHLANGEGEKRTRKFKTIWNEKALNYQNGTKTLKELFEANQPFVEYPKPVHLLKQIITMSGSDADDIILDFFAGSGTTAHAVMDLNKEDGGSRKYICVQLPEKTDEKSAACKAGYVTIADIAKERIRRTAKKIEAETETEIKQKEAEIEKIKLELDLGDNDAKISALQAEILNLESQDLGFKVLKLQASNFKQWRQLSIKTREELETQLELFVDSVAPHAAVENIVYELALKSGKSLTSRVEHKASYYAINYNELILMLEEVNQDVIEAVIAEKPQKVIALDRIFAGNDQLKTNTAIQMKDAEIEFKTI